MSSNCSLAPNGPAWQSVGLREVPEVITKATNDYKVDQDIIGNWLDEHTQAGGDVLKSALYENYKSWAMDNGLKPASAIAISRRMEERGHTLKKTDGMRRWVGLSLKSVLNTLNAQASNPYKKESQGH